MPKSSIRYRKILIITFLLLISSYCVTYAQLQAEFRGTPTVGCAPIRVEFEDLSTGNHTSWKWDLGNGTISTLQNPSTTYFNPGAYTIRLTVYNGSDSSIITKTNYITVYGSPIIDFNANPKVGCYPLAVSFLDMSAAGSGSILSWRWDFGDGNISNLRNPSHVYINAGMFNVSLTVTNTNGCNNTLNKLNLIKVSEGPKAKFTNTFPPVCGVPATVNFTNQSTGTDITSYFWDFGDGKTSSLANPSHIYNNAGIYTVKLIVRNASGCTDTITKPDLLSIGIYRARFDIPSSACINEKFNIINTSFPSASVTKVSWDFGDGTNANVSNPVKSYATAGTYTVKLVAEFGSCTDSFSKTINVLPGPTANFTGNNLFACRPPLTTSFTNTSVNGTPIRWFFGDGDSSTLENPVHTYDTAGNFTVTLIIKNANGCTDTLKRPSFVNVTPPPKIESITPLAAEGCIPYPVQFQPTITTLDPVVSYKWDFGNGVTSNNASPAYTYTIEGKYAPLLKIITSGGCVDTFRTSVTVGKKPTAEFSATPRNACASTGIHFTDASTSGINRWFWIFGDGTVSDNSNPVHPYVDTGLFTISLIVWRNGCPDTATKNDYVYIRPPIASYRDSFSCNNQYQHYFRDISIGALYRKYWFGDGDSTEEVNPAHIYKDTGRYAVTQFVRNDFCESVATYTILVLNEKAGFNATDSIGCKSTLKRFSATSNPWNIKSYLWNFGDGVIVLDTLHSTISHVYKSPGVFNVTLTITDLNGCIDVITQPVTVAKYGPTANIGQPQNSCIHSSVNFADLSQPGVNPITQWIWDFGDKTVQTYTRPPFQHTYNEGGLYSVRLIVVDSYGCRDTLSRSGNILVNDPQADFFSVDTLKCRNSPVNFSQKLTGNNLTLVQWYFGDGDSASGNNPQHTYIDTGIYNIKLIITDNIGCSDTMFKPQYIKVYDAKALFTMSDSFTTCPPLFVSFTNQSSNGVKSFWNFGDGNISTLTNPSHTYTISGLFNVGLSVTGNGGCKDSSTKQIRVLGPTGTFTYTPKRGCVPLGVQFISSTNNTNIYTWDYNDGTINFGSNTVTTHMYNRLGNFVPRIILEDSAGCKLPIVGADTIKVKGITTHIRNSFAHLVCDSAFIMFNDSTETNDTIQNYLWNFGDGNTSNLQNPTHHYNVPGLYTVTLFNTTITGCTSGDTLRTPVKVVPSPQINIIGDTTGCVPKTVHYTSQLLNQDTSVVRWEWDFANGQTSTLQNPPDQIYPIAGNYNIRSIAINGSGCADTVYNPLIVYPLPLVDAGVNNFICRGHSYTLNPSGATTYIWNQDSTLSCSACTNPIANPGFTTQYNVEGTDNHGCKASDTVLISVKQPFILTPSAGDTICVGQSVQLGASGAERYTWSPSTYLNNAAISNPIATPNSTITYRVIGRDTLGCFTDTNYVAIRVYDIPTVNIVEDKVDLSVGNSIQLHSTSSPDVIKWRWTPSSGLSCSDCQNPVTSPKQNVVYTLNVSNGGNCTAEDKVTISLICNGGNIYIPNTFSPNGDGANDIFYPRGKGIFGIKSMRIFSRWGELIYEKMNFSPNDITAGWDGIYKNEKAASDVYVYTVEVICENNVIFNLKGNVTLLR